MIFDRFYIFSIILMCIILFYSYYYFSQNPKFKKIFEKISKNNIILYIISLIICYISFFIFIYYIYIKNNFSKDEIFSIFMFSKFIIFFSIFLIPSYILYYHNNDKKIKYLIFIILLIISLSCFGLLYTIYSINDNTLLKLCVIIGLMYFLFHKLILDFGIYFMN
jgi:hypothetical protein